MLFWPEISAAERQPGGVLREGSLTALLIGEPGVCMYVREAERLHLPATYRQATSGSFDLKSRQGLRRRERLLDCLALWSLISLR